MHGEVRLNSAGLVELCLDGVWGTVSNSSWDDVDARVVCRQLGLPTTGEYIELKISW